MRRGLCLLLLLGSLVAVSPASAAPTWLPPELVSVGGPLEPSGNFLLEWPPSVAIDGDGNVALGGSQDPGPLWNVLGVSRPAGGPWGSPVAISRPAEDALAPQVGFDTAGDETAIWSSFDRPHSVIMAATRPAGGAWGEPVAVSAPGAENQLNSLAVAPSGEVTAIWTEQVGTEEYVVEAASKRAGGAWEEPVELSATGTGAELSPAIGSARVATDAAGDLTAAWEFTVSGETRVQVAERPAGGAWTEPTTLSTTEEPGVYPIVATDPRGDATVVWSSRTAGGDTTILSAGRVVGGGWEPRTVAANLGVVRASALAMDAAGEATVAWEHTSGPQSAATASRPLGGGWSAAVGLGTASREPQVAYRGEEAVAAWSEEEGSGSVIETAARSTAGIWGSPIRISRAAEGGNFAGFPVLAFDAEGEGVATWDANHGDPSDYEFQTEAAGFDAVGPRLGSLSIPTAGTAGVPLDFSVSPLDVWSGVAATEWSFGDGARASGASISHAYASAGTNELTLTSTDRVGNTTSISQTITIGPAPPTTAGTGTAAGRGTVPQPAPKPGRPRLDLRYTPNHPHRPDPTGGPRYTFHFGDPTGPATFRCSLDGAPFRVCNSPKVYRRLRRGLHVFRVRAISAGGGSSPVRTVRFSVGGPARTR